MKHIKLFESLKNNIVSYNDFIDENADKSINYSKYIAENADKSINYSKYIAENISFNMNYGSSGNPLISANSEIVKTEYLGNSKIDGEPLYKHHMISSGLTTIEITKGRLDGQWYNDLGQPISKPFIPDKDMDWWNKEKNKPLSKYKLFLIGSLIVSIVTVVVLIFI